MVRHVLCLPIMNKITRLGVVGGVERSFRHLLARSLSRNIRVEFHAGHMRGSGERELNTLVQRSDLIVLVTDVNSHNAVHRTRELTRHYQRPCFIVRRLGTQMFSQILDTLGESSADQSPEQTWSSVAAITTPPAARGKDQRPPAAGASS